MTWDDVATTYDVDRCPACPTGDHRLGWARGQTVHWADRRMTKAGLRRYLMLISSIRLLRFDALPRWQRIYQQNVWAASAARSLHTRIPAHLSDTDRTEVRWLTSNLHVPPAVSRWARRTH